MDPLLRLVDPLQICLLALVLVFVQNPAAAFTPDLGMSAKESARSKQAPSGELIHGILYNRIIPSNLYL